jgi:hypothetical protein
VLAESVGSDRTLDLTHVARLVTRSREGMAQDHDRTHRACVRSGVTYAGVNLVGA